MSEKDLNNDISSNERNLESPIVTPPPPEFPRSEGKEYSRKPSSRPKN